VWSKRLLQSLCDQGSRFGQVTADRGGQASSCWPPGTRTSEQESIRRFLGDDVANRVGPIWGHNDEGFMNGMWNRTGQPGLWLMGGALMESRLWSRFLALQLKADLEGMAPAASQTCLTT
jgi:hypothetical protein